MSENFRLMFHSTTIVLLVIVVLRVRRATTTTTTTTSGDIEGARRTILAPLKGCLRFDFGLGMFDVVHVNGQCNPLVFSMNG